MTISRRLLLSAGVAMLGAASAPRLWASTRFDGGAWQVETLSDGKLVLPTANLVPEADAAVLLPLAGITGPQWDVPLNVTLMRRDKDVVLFDVGSGPDFVPTAGLLIDALSAAAVAPEDVTQVLFTHGHPDHLWGVLDEFDEPLFPNAVHRIGKIERDYWIAPETAASLPEERQSFAAGASRRIDAMGERLGTFDDGEAVLPGVTARLLPGHTPGHMGFDIDGGLMVIGDAATSQIAFARPDLPGGNDHDPATAASTRAALLAALEKSGQAIIGYHLPDGGIGMVRRADSGYQFVSA